MVTYTVAPGNAGVHAKGGVVKIKTLWLPMLSILIAAGLSGCSEKKEASAPPPPEVEVVAVVQQDVPVHQRMGSLPGRIGQRHDPGPGAGLPGQAEL
jgi:hypothetical protein